MTFKKFKIVIYTWAVPKGGLFKVIEKESEFLACNFERPVFATSETVPKPYEESFRRIQGISLSDGKCKNIGRDMSLFFPGLDLSINGGILGNVIRVYTFLKRERPHVILAHQLLSALIVLPYAFVHRVRVVLVLHDNPFMFIEDNSKKRKRLKSLPLRALAYRIEKFTLKRTKYVICTTTHIKHSVIRHIGQTENLIVADYGIDTFPTVEGKSRNILLTVSKWSRFRKPEKYLEILKYLPESITLTVAGRWDSEKDQTAFINLVDSMKLNGRVDVLTDLTEGELSKLYDRTRVFIRLGFNETGTGQAILEAIGHGCPVVVSRGLGAAEIIHDGLNGFIVDENTIKEIASKIIELFQNEALFDFISNASYSLASSNSWEQYMKKILQAVL